MQPLSPALQAALNNQLTTERQAHATYSALSAVCEVVSFPGFAKWHASAASEELSHADMVRDFLIDRDGLPIYAALEGVTLSSDPVATFSAAALLEASVTESLMRLYYAAEVDEDEQVCRLASDMLIEQRYSEHELADILRRLTFANGNAAAVLMLDEQLGGG